MAESDEWQPVKIVSADATETHERSGGGKYMLLVLETTGQMDSEWTAFFEDPQVPPKPTLLHDPIIGSNAKGRIIGVRLEPGREKEAIQHVRARVEQANKKYAGEVIPRRRAEEQERRAREQEHTQSLEDASERAKRAFKEVMESNKDN
jgi:hypothetical protein